MQVSNPQGDRSSIEGLWVLLVQNEGQIDTADAEGRVPMMARAGNDQTYLLGFKNMPNARKFIASAAIDNVEPRMVVKSNKTEFLRIAQAAGVSGILVDYDPSTQQYAAAAELY